MDDSVSASPPIDSARVLQLIGEQGPLSTKLKFFEVREQQKKMLAHLIEAFNTNAVALIEAGTGTGKSVAYLIPSLLAAAIWNDRVVISTHTIALQEQLLEKDLPLLMEALGIESKVVLVKGMGNYACLRKLDDLVISRHFLEAKDQETLDNMERLIGHQGMGSKSEFPFNPPSHLWDMVQADYETCNGPDCPHYQNCYYVQARKNAQDAKLLIVNHHLLFADLIAKGEAQNFLKGALLPSYNRLVIDEAHHLEEVASDYFSSKISRLELLKILSKISFEHSGKDQGRLPEIKDKLLKAYPDSFSKDMSQLFNTLSIDIPALRREIVKEIAEVFHLLDLFQKNSAVKTSSEKEANKIRLKNHHYQSKVWSETIAKKLIELGNLLQRFASELSRIEGTVKSFEDEKFLDSVKGTLFDLKNFAKRLEEEAFLLNSFAKEPLKAEQIRWIESELTKGGLNVSCIEAALDISELLLKYLFNPLDTVALLSATLTTKGSFAYLKNQMGINEKNLKGRPFIEAAYDSPFDFNKQALLMIPKDIPLPTEPDFLSHAMRLIEEAIYASRGNAFILFTSYDMLKKCYDSLYERLSAAKYYPLRQGAEARKNLLSRFVKQDRSILFGTDSFWEGVDVAGEALRLVIIVKLPFKVPSDPLIEAKSEAMKANGKDPFRELLLPQAAIKLKQGFGRLIRNKKDRGCIICLDKRLITKSYGQYLLKSLPPCPTMTLESSALKAEMIDFYKKTYYLTK